MTQHWTNVETGASQTGAPRFLGALSPRAGHARALVTHALPPAGPAETFEAPHLFIAHAAAVHPPIRNTRAPDGSFLLIDGEVHNAAELFADTDDIAAALLADFKRRGEGAFARLDMAGIAVLWDAQAQALYVVRDSMGHAQVFTAEHSGAVLFASDLPALMTAGAAREMDAAALDFYLARGFVPAPLTFLKAARRVPPAHFARIRPGEAPRVSAYWRPTGEPARAPGIEEVADEWAAQLPRAVARRADGNPGILLSGGVDSKLLLAVATQATGRSLPSFTFRYENYDGEFNEAALARQCADRFGSPHTEISVSPHTISARLPQLLRSFGEPFSYGLHSAFMGAVREAGVSNLLAGTGADSLHLIWQERNALRVKNWPRALRAPLECISAKLRRAPYIGTQAGELFGALWSARTGLPHFVCAYMMPAALRAELYRDKGLLAPARAAWNRLRAEAMADYAGESDIARYKFMTQRFFGMEMMGSWNHWAGRAHGIMIRSVYLDRSLVEAMSRIPLTRPMKAELRHYASRLMPREMAYTKKLPQSVPIEVWTRGPLRAFVMDSLAPDRLNRSGLFAPKTVQRMAALHMSGQRDYGWQLWSLICVLAWQDLFRAGAVSG